MQQREIGKRLRAYRLGAGLSADEVGARLNLSRAAVYRFEKFGINQIETLERVAALLDVSLASLLGVAVEYTRNVAAYLERYRQIEETADWLFVAFSPISYVLTSENYDVALRLALAEEMRRKFSRERSSQIVTTIMSILTRRKATYRRRRPRMTNVISAAEIVRFARAEFAVAEASIDQRRLEIAHQELERIAGLFRRPPLDVQLGLIFDRLPSTSFSIAQDRETSTVLISPFRLGPEINSSAGVAMITSAPEAIQLHRDVGEELWERVVTGGRAASFIRAQLT